MPGPSGVRAGDLHRVLHRFGAAVHEQSFLGKFAGRDLVHALGQAHIVFVGRHLNAGMQKTFELALDCIHHRLAAMTHVEAADAAGKIQVAVAVNVFEPGVFGLGHVDGRADR